MARGALNGEDQAGTRRKTTRRVVVACLVGVICLVAAPALRQVEGIRLSKTMTLPTLATQVAAELFAWVGQIAVGAVVALLIYDRWAAQQRAVEEEKARQRLEQEQMVAKAEATVEEAARAAAHNDRIARAMRLALADLRHSLKLLTFSVATSNDYSLLEDAFDGTYDLVVSIEDPPESWKRHRIMAGLRRVEERLMELGQNMGQADQLGTSARQFIVDARKESSHVEKGAAGCLRSALEISQLLTTPAPDMQAAGMALRRLAAIWKQSTRGVIFDLTSDLLADGSDEPVERVEKSGVEGLVLAMAQIMHEVAFLYEEAARLHDEFRPTTAVAGT